MSDHFEKAMQGIVLRSKENGGAGVDDILKALVATNEDLDENQKETLRLFAKHVKDGKERAATLAEQLKNYQRDQATECTEKHRSLFADERRIDSEASAIDHAALIADAAEMAANKVAAHVETAAKKAATVRVDAAKDAAVVLTDAAEEAPKKFTREQLVSNFWLLVGLLFLTGLISGIATQLIKLVFG